MIIEEQAEDEVQPERPPGSRAAERAPAPKARWGRAGVESSLTFLAFISLFAGYSIWLGNRFLSVDARMLDVHQSVPVILLALAVLVTLISGLFDLSVASVASLSVYLTVGLTLRDGWPFPLVLLVVMAVGAAVGVVNGLLVEKLKVNTFIATLGSGSVVLGLSAVYSGGSVISIGEGALPAWFKAAGSFGEKPPFIIIALGVVLLLAGVFFALRRMRPTRLGMATWVWIRLAIVAAAAAFLFTVGLGFLTSIPWTIVILLVAAVIVWILMDRTTFGRNLRAIGSNREAARLAGVPVPREVIKAFVLGGALSALAGVTLAANQGSASPDAAGGFLLAAFAAAFLSTVIFSAGRFTVLGTVLGGIFVVWTAIGLIIGGMSQTWTNVINGLVLVVAVALSAVARRRTS